MSVSARFSKLLDNIALTDAQTSSGILCRESVVKCLNGAYWNSASDSANSMSVGSWGKFTRIRPPRDVDVVFKLPSSVYNRFEQRSGNKQSQLLQEVKGHLQRSFTTTSIRGDGPVVLVPFTAFNVEVIPAFPLTTGKYWVSMTDNGGRYKEADYEEEISSISRSNTTTNSNTRELIRMMKCWQGYCSVDIKSFWIEITAVNFLDQWEHKGKTRVYYDWMVRDYLLYLYGQKNRYIFAPGTYELMNLGEKWASKASSAWVRARKACEHEAAGYGYSAGEEWQKIFGSDMPLVAND